MKTFEFLTLSRDRRKRGMTIGLLKDMAQTRPTGALLGIDAGKKTLGLALAAPGQSFATPIGTIARGKFAQDVAALARTARDYDIKGLIIGFPLNMDGSEGPRCQSVRHFAQSLETYPEIVGPSPWIALWDERLSTASVEDFVGEFVGIKKAKQKGTIDALAAREILQGALNFLGSAF